MSSISKSQREQISKILKERIAFGRQKVVEIRASLTQPDSLGCVKKWLRFVHH